MIGSKDALASLSTVAPVLWTLYSVMPTGITVTFVLEFNCIM